MDRIAHKPAPWLGAVLLGVLMVGMSMPALASQIALLNNGFTIRHDHHRLMGANTRLYFSADEQSFTDIATSEIDSYQEDLTPPSPPPPAASAAPDGQTALTPKPAARPPVDLNQVVNSASADYHLDPDLVNSVIHAESGFNAHAVSPKGARGLMQLMPSTADQLGVKDSFDPEKNVGGGSHYLRELLERYNFDLVKALAAYNAGPERVDQYHGVPPFHETKAYVARIIHEYNQKIAQEERAAAQAKKLSKAQASKATAHSNSTRSSTMRAAHASTSNSNSTSTSSKPAPKTGGRLASSESSSSP